MLRTINTAARVGALHVRAFSTNVAERHLSPANAKLLNVTLNGVAHQVPEGRTILEAANQAGQYIPTLCFHPLLAPVGTCRLCLVDANMGKLVPACMTKVADGMKITTSSPAINDADKFNLTMLRARHPNECMTCEVNGKCEFQNLMYRYQIEDVFPKVPRSEHISAPHNEKDKNVDDSSVALFRDMNKCVMCYRCMRACHELQGMDVLGTEDRGDRVGLRPTDGLPLESTDCINCGACSLVCPVGAIVEKSALHEVLTLLKSREKIMVVQTAPAVRIAISEDFNMEPGKVSTGQLVTALKRLGFNYVFDVNLSADLTIMEEGTELLKRIKTGGPFPMFTSCCPAWVNLVEKKYPGLIPNLSTAKSPQGMLGPVIKTYFARKLNVAPEKICVVSIMPCVAKKEEAARKQLRDATEGMFPDVDHVLTTRELGHLIELQRIPFGTLPESEFDDPLGIGTGAAQIFGVTGGVMEAALRTAYELGTGKKLEKVDFESVRGLDGIREATIDFDGTPIKVAVCHGMANVREMLERVKEGKDVPAFIEMMSCTGGCIGGAGNPKNNKDQNVVINRAKATYDMDGKLVLRKSHENPAIAQLYKEFFGEPGSELAHHLLHTHYQDRSNGAPAPEEGKQGHGHHH